MNNAPFQPAPAVKPAPTARWQAPRALRVGDVLFFGGAERVLVESVNPGTGGGNFQPVRKDGHIRRRGTWDLRSWTGDARQRRYEAHIERNIFADGEPWEVVRAGVQAVEYSKDENGRLTVTRYAPGLDIRFCDCGLFVFDSQWAELGLPMPEFPRNQP